MINKNAVWNPEDLGIPYKEESDRGLTIFAVIASIVLVTCAIFFLVDVVVLTKLSLTPTI